MNKEPEEHSPERILTDEQWSKVRHRLLQAAIEPVDPELMAELAEKFPSAGCVFLVPNNSPLTDEEVEKIMDCPILFCGPNANYNYREWIRDNEAREAE